MKAPILTIVGIALLVVAFVFVTLLPIEAQQARPVSITTPNGSVVEEVQVGGSCVVIVTHVARTDLEVLACGSR